MVLYSDTLLDELYQRGEALNGSFLVSLLSREEPPIRSFREAIEAWHSGVPEAYRARFTDRLRSPQNDTFFQAFCEVAVHHLLVRSGTMRVAGYPDPMTFPYFSVNSGTGRGSALVSVVSFIPDDHPAIAQQTLVDFIHELNQVRGRFRFAVYLRRWLPMDFDPTVVRRALESWFARLEQDTSGGVYAEYRDGDIHVEFSVLERLDTARDGLVAFHLPPLESNQILDAFKSTMDEEVERYRKLTDRSKPLVVVLFNNEEWRLGTNYLHEFFYGKPRLSMGWRSRQGRREIIRDFGAPFVPSIFNSGLGDDLGAVLLIEKVWEDLKVRLKVRVLNNPWCPNPTPDGMLEGKASLQPLKMTADQAYVRWEHLDQMLVDLT